jgi:hypothetical protein
MFRQCQSLIALLPTCNRRWQSLENRERPDLLSLAMGFEANSVDPHI